KDINTELTEKDFNQETANNYYPGQVIAKNPVMHNESKDGNPIYVATKLTFKDNTGATITRADFEAKYATIEGFSANWELIDGASNLYMFKTVLAPDTATDPIFTGTKVLAGINEVIKTEYASTTIYTVDSAGNKTEVSHETVVSNPAVKYYDAEGKEIDALTLPKFQIDVKGYAVQADGLTAEEAKAELVKLAEANK
ncbi:MAG: hypothetical protein RR986_04570, partial [Longicatena sp.]